MNEQRAITFMTEDGIGVAVACASHADAVAESLRVHYGALVLSNKPVDDELVALLEGAEEL